jgi:hypothetical protein
VAVLVWTSKPVFAADVTPATPPVAAAGAPVSVRDPGCASCQTCEHGSARGSCNTCGKLLTGDRLHKDKHAPYPVTLCPGACFGYFQTQWRKWDEVCPYPYLGIGVSDAQKIPGTGGPIGPRPGGGGELAPPRPIDPKSGDPKKLGSNPSLLPTIPVAPPSKFGQ